MFAEKRDRTLLTPTFPRVRLSKLSEKLATERLRAFLLLSVQATIAIRARVVWNDLTGAKPRKTNGIGKLS